MWKSDMHAVYNSHFRRAAHSLPILAIFGTFGDLTDVIFCAKLHIRSVKGVFFLRLPENRMFS